MKPFSRRADPLSRLLEEARPAAPETLVARLVAEVAAAPRRRRPLRRLAPAAVLSAAVVVSLGSVGGLSYAATIAADVVHSVTRHAAYLGSRMPLAAQVQQVHDAATDQYGGGGGGNSQGGGGGGNNQGGGGGGNNQGGGGNNQGGNNQTSETTTATPASSGSVTVAPSSSSQSGSVDVTWNPGTFTAPAVVTVDTKPPTATPIIGPSHGLVSIVVTDPSTGQQVHQLASPLTVVFEPPAGGFPRGFVPLISTDGTTWRATAQLTTNSLPEGQADGFYRWTTADGAAHPAGTLLILTRHLTLFAVLFSSNASVSESGRKAPQAGSGLFGDPTRNHVGAPVLKRIGTMPTVVAAAGRVYVPVTFLVDEQAVLHLAVFGPDDVPELIVQQGSVIHRSSTPLTGPPTHNLKVLVLRPGTISSKIQLDPRQILPGRRYRLRLWAVDYDGHTTVRYITFRG
ncbi:MAG TPA: hypothetical protein VGN27_14140 [Gaiellaceae bacterium]|nr:hypothetical protein [Gaiellaceae bacterium]